MLELRAESAARGRGVPRVVSPYEPLTPEEREELRSKGFDPTVSRVGLPRLKPIYDWAEADADLG